MPVNALSRRDFMRLGVGSNRNEPVIGSFFDVGAVTYDTPVLTANDRFYRTPCLTPQVPSLDRSVWTLTVDGLVRQPIVLSYADLRERPAVGQMRTLVNIGNPPGGEQIGNAVWRGCLLRDLLTESQLQPASTHLRFDSADGYFTSIPLDDALTQDVLLAYEMNGALLPPEQGYPLRVLVPGRYDLKSPGWLTRITALDYDDPGIWECEPHHWSGNAGVKTQSKIMQPLHRQALRQDEAVALQGVAFAGLQTVTGVEVSINRGNWMPAMLRPSDSPYAWLQWYTLWTPQLPGEYEITVRATDSTGFRQEIWPEMDAGIFSAGSAAMHSIVVTVG